MTETLTSTPMSHPPILIDVSRLIWRQWTRRLPTGIDRVCLAYLEHYRSRARAVVQFRGFRRVLNGSASQQLFDLLLNGSGHFRSRLVVTLAGAALRGESGGAGQVYLNVGHTGLNSPYLQPWLVRRKLRPLFLIHDLIPITHPQYCREGEAARHEQRMITALRAADGLIFNSAATQIDLANFANARNLPVPPGVVAWLGVNTAQALPASGCRTGERPYFVMIGTIEARKNHLLMLQVWADLVARRGNQAPDLVIIGQRGWEAEDATAILDSPDPLQGHVRELSRCDDKMMASLLSGARAMLMPSHIEGYGLPLIEALQQGVPVIASDLPVFREIVGDIPTYLDPNDRNAWVRAVIDYLDDGNERRRQLKAIGGFKAPMWDDHFSRVDRFLDTL